MHVKYMKYEYSALEPAIPELVLKTHYENHHMKYIANIKQLIGTESLPDMVNVLQNPHVLSLCKKDAIMNNAGGHYNHTLFWDVTDPSVKDETEPEVLRLVTEQFGSVDRFCEEFKKHALGVFGSGWCWLIYQEGALKITTTANQYCPVSTVPDAVPIACLDLWEHAYYYEKFARNRACFIDLWITLVNWNVVNSHYQNAKRGFCPYQLQK